MTAQNSTRAGRTVLSPEMEARWGYIPIHHLILATPNFIVFLDEELDVDWKTSAEWDEQQADKNRRSAILNRAATLESGEWDTSDKQTTLNLRRQIAEAVARCLDHDFNNAEQMLERADVYRTKILTATRRKGAVREYFEIKNAWRKYYSRWTIVHYVIGVAAIVSSTLVASKPALLGMTNDVVSLFAWFAALLTALLTFLAPDKKASKYARAWSILNGEISRYNADDSRSINDVLHVYNQAENILSETSISAERPGSSNG